MRSTRPHTPLVVVVAAALLSACGSGGGETDPHPTLTSIGDGDLGMFSIRGRQKLIYQVKPEGADDSEYVEITGQEIFTDGRLSLANLDGALFADAISIECGYQRWLAENEGVTDSTPFDLDGSWCSGSTCSEALCKTELAVCEANLYLELASLTAPRELHGRIEIDTDSVLATVLVPIQDLATRAALQETAQYRAADGIASAIQYTRDPANDWSDPSPFDDLYADAEDCDAPYSSEDPEFTRAEAWTVGIEELYQLFFEAGDKAVTSYLALADAELGAHADLSIATQSAFMIRSHAVNMLTGNPTILSRGTDLNLCTSPQLSSRAQMALDLMREAALSPSDVLAIPGSNYTGSSIGIDELLAGSSDALVERLSALRGVELSLEELFDETGLDRDDFQEARQSLAEEIRVFARDLDKTLPDRPNLLTLDPTDQVSDLFAATGSIPSPLPATYFRGQALEESNSSIFFSQWYGYPFDMSTAFFLGVVPLNTATGPYVLDYALSDFLHHTEDDPTAPPHVQRMVDRVKRIISQTRRDTPGYVQIWARYTDPERNYAFVALPDADTTELMLVTDSADLACAERAEIEGQPCTWDDITPRYAQTIDDIATYVSTETSIYDSLESETYEVWGFFESETKEVVSLVDERINVLATSELMGRDVVVFPELPSGQVYYLMRPRSGASPRTVGGYEALGSFVVASQSDLNQLLQEYVEFIEELSGEEIDTEITLGPDSGSIFLPGALVVNDQLWTSDGFIAPALDKRAGDIMTPSRDWCARPAVSCSGISYDARIPLENDITSDQYEFESSWRTNLDLAEQAAAEADVLGEATIQLGLDIDVAAEGALEELESKCGLDISLDPLREYLAEHPEVTDPLAVIEGEDGEVPEFTATALARLRTCIGADSVTDFVSLGSEELCVWYLDGDRRQLCALADGDETELACPRVVEPEDASGCRAPVAEDAETFARYTAYKVGTEADDLLNYFMPPDIEATLPVTDPAPCGELRQLRGALATSSTASEVARAWHAAMQGTNFWQASHLREIGQSIVWEAQHGSYSRLRIGPKIVADTGDLESGPSTSGLCGTIDGLRNSYDCMEDGVAVDQERSLLCNPWDCSDESTRAQLNYRLATAAMAARWLSQNSFSDFRVPERRDWPDAATRTDEHFTNAGDQFGPQVQLFNSHTNSNDDASCFTDESSSDTTWLFLMPPGTTDGEFTGDDNVGSARCEHNALWIRTLVDDGLSPNYGMPITETMAQRTKRQAQSFVNNTTTQWGFFSSHFTSENGEDDLVYMYCADCATNDSSGLLLVGSQSDVLPWRYSDSRFNDFSPHDTEMREQMIFDGLELLCEAGRDDQDIFPCGPQPIGISKRSQVNWAASQVECLGNAIKKDATRTVFVGVPRAAVDALAESAAVGVVGEAGGEHGALISQLRTAMIEVSEIPFEIGAELQAIARDTRSTLLALDSLDLANENLRLERQQAISDAMASCASASVGFNNWITFGSAASLACGSATVTLRNTIKEIRNEQSQNENAEDQTLIDLEASAAQHSVNMTNLLTQYLGAREQMQSILRDLERSRSEAQRLFSRALFLGSDGAGTVFHTAVTTRRRMSTAVERYERAKADAIRLAFLARRSIEQRFGVDLSAMGDNMSQVDAPATWADSVCELSGIDYDRIRDESDTDYENYADEFVGEYVRKLRQFVDSYVHDFPTAQGYDRAVISLRDDIQNIRDTCEVAAPNLLAHSNDLTRRSSEDSYGWDVVDVAQGSLGVDLPNAMAITPLEDDGELTVQDRAFGAPRPFSVRFGVLPCDEAACGYQPETALAQTVDVPGGHYRLSWYGRPGSVGSDPANAVIVRGADSLAVYSTEPPSVEAVSGDWNRYSLVFYEPGGEPLQLVITNPVAGAPAGTEVDLAGLMLENVSRLGSSAGEEGMLGPFVETSDEGLYRVNVCEDTDGDQFRARSWRRNCVTLCDSGFGAGCASSAATTYCYWETQFHIGQEAIDRGMILRNAGFAHGNFNYRIDSFAVNFVGSAARVCADTSLPSTCYSSGYIPYTLEHLGPYEVRNYRGDTLTVPLYPGVVQSADGLAAERYITNPISSADEALLEQYRRYELQGRPLTGSYVLRVWDGPGVNFEGIEDVQIVLDYRYWTRQR